MLSAALGVAAKLDIADKLATGSRTAAELAGEANCDGDALYRVLRLLAGVGVFEEKPGRRFALNAAADTLRRDAPGSLRSLVAWLCEPFHFQVYAETLHSVRTGTPAADKVVGGPLFEHFARDPELSEIFNEAMTGISAMVVPAVLETFDFSGTDVLVDVAGGHGFVLTSILQKYPRMRGVLSDVGHVIEGAKPRIARLGLADRCRTEVIDFFTSVPAGGDTYVMKHIIHDWDDDRAATILGHIRTALAGKPNGKVVLIEAVVGAPNVPDFAKLIDLEMLLLPGGRERTEAEFRQLFKRSGFELTRIVPNRSPLWTIEATVV
jgi:hypothetical protein